MKHRPLKHLCGLFATAAIALVLIGCNGKAGQNGLNGTNGTNGQDGQDGTNATLVVDAAFLTPEQWAALKPTGTITGVTIPTTAPRNPVVTFRLVDPAGNGIKGLGTFTRLNNVVPDRSGNLATLTDYPNLAFALAKLVPEDPATKTPSKWVSYVVNTAPAIKASTGAAVPAAPTRPSTDNTGTLVDNGDGTYRYTFYRDITAMQGFLDAATYTAPSVKSDLGDVTYAPTQVHRLTLQLSGAARGTGSNTANGVTVATAVNMENPINVVYDFTPGTTGVGTPVAAGTDIRDVVSIGKCNECHDKLAFHGGGRVEARYCVVCHTDQRKFGYAVATAGTTTTYTGSTNKFNIDSAGTQTTAAGDMTAMAHRIHMGTNLTNTGYNYASVYFEKLGYSMLDGGARMCIKCHSNVPQADNWKTKPTRLACGTCHDGVDFATGHGPGVPPQTSDVTCALCHEPADITAYHMTQNVTPHNPTVAEGLATFTYEISSATATGSDVAIKFRIMKNGTAATLATPAATITQTVAGFTGAPSFLLAWTMTQEGITTPSDYNNLAAADGNPVASNYQPPTVSIATLLDTDNAATGNITGPDGSGYYTATILGKFPAGAKMRSVSLQGYFTQTAGTWDSDGNGVIDASDTATAARHAISVIKAVTGDTARRKVIDSAKCANCHEWFEGHGGNRVYDVQVCVTCHVPGLTTSGRGISDSALSTYYNAGLFTANDKTALTAWTGLDFSVNPVTAGYTNVALLFPQTTNNFKDMIHGIHAGNTRTTNSFKIVRDRTPSAVNVINAAEIGYPGRLTNCQGCHTYNGYSGVPANTLASRDEAVHSANSTLVAGSTTVYANNTVADAKAALAQISPRDLMTTPFTASCASCHDSAPAAAHMKLNGGQIMVPRSALNNAAESCAVCHGAGSTYDPVKVHK